MEIFRQIFSPQPQRPEDLPSLPTEPSEKFLKIRQWIASLTPTDRTRFTNQYLVPVFGQAAAEWVKQQLEAEQEELKISLGSRLAELRTIYAKEIQPRILEHIGQTLKKIEKVKSKTTFKDPVLRALWDVAIARTGLDVIAAGQTTFEDMLRDFDKLVEVLLRMSLAFEQDTQQSKGRKRS